jgi:hypothetical protein
VSARHANVGEHLPRHDARMLSAILRGEHDAARRRRRDVRWAADRVVPLGVTESPWPIEVQS